MKKTLLIIALFIGFGNVNAQSDATKEETLNWLNTYLKKFAYEATLQNTKGGNFTHFYISIRSKGEIHTELSKKNSEAWYQEDVKITSISKIIIEPMSTNENYLLEFWVNDRSVEVFYDNGDGDDPKIKKMAVMTLYFSNKTELERVYKALKHLFTFYNQEVEFVDKIALANKF